MNQPSPTGRLVSSQPEVQHLPGTPLYGSWRRQVSKATLASTAPNLQQLLRDSTRSSPVAQILSFVDIEKRVLMHMST